MELSKFQEYSVNFLRYLEMSKNAFFGNWVSRNILTFGVKFPITSQQQFRNRLVILKWACKQPTAIMLTKRPFAIIIYTYIKYAILQRWGFQVYTYICVQFIQLTCFLRPQRLWCVNVRVACQLTIKKQWFMHELNALRWSSFRQGGLAEQ